MANNAEVIGRLLANSTLWRGERELLRKQDPPPAETPQPASQPAAPAITHDAKATAAVLLTLLDERLASNAAAADSSKALSGSRPAPAADSSNAPKGIAAMYAEDGLIAGGDATKFDAAFAAEQSRTREFLVGNPVELQSFIQRLAAIAAGQSDGRRQRGWAGGGKGDQSAPFGGISGIQIAAAAITIMGLAALIASGIPS